MARKKKLADYDAKMANLKAEMAKLQAERRAAVLAASAMVGEIALNIFDNIPTDKAGCREYFNNVNILIERHKAEFDKLCESQEKVEKSDKTVDSNDLTQKVMPVRE